MATALSVSPHNPFRRRAASHSGSVPPLTTTTSSESVPPVPSISTSNTNTTTSSSSSNPLSPTSRPTPTIITSPITSTNTNPQTAAPLTSTVTVTSPSTSTSTSRHPQSRRSEEQVPTFLEANPDAPLTHIEIREILQADDDLPPSYTPVARENLGEQTLEFGPRRPFQAAPPAPSLNRTGTGGSGGYLTPNGTGNNNTSPGLSGQGGLGSTLRSNSSQDLYNAGASTSRYAPPGGNAPSRGYAPPSTSPPPPTHPMSRSRSQSSAGNEGASGSGGGGGGRIEDDGRPTHTPVPGHPLLRRGNILVYPTGYECWKCHNTGYKQSDPTHPCNKCWERYGRPYRGATTASTGSSSAAGSSSTAAANGTTNVLGGNFQRPLPSFKAPWNSLSHNHSQSHSYTHQQPQPQPSIFSYPGPATSSGPRSAIPLSHNPSITLNRAGPHPPAGATVVKPGDPRIGGRLCWRCEGSGLVSFMIFDEDVCPVCGGVGRTF